VITIEPGAARVMREHAAAAYPNECCGALVGVDEGGARIISAAWPIENTAPESPARRFSVAPSDYREVEVRASREGRSLLGFYHSHPDAPAAPSQHDLQQAWPNIDYLILSVVRARPADITCWRLRDDRAAFAREEIAWQPES
jgi:proteasome lid subunit RPN8/RPN11